ncbi:Wound-induced protein, Wun1, subgroup [Parasponia andersonii]|uniref:Wound-induced protein, Wun1, subgroup n=1 Tax=Parasponia andersonii TaxID=3476 RepID=A0A2P5E0K1_PARAD|nr:Wound-induced protein, Wun1, subgroup [Parasponia andersonii]
MRLLTGASSPKNDDVFQFVPQSFASFGTTVLVEGCDSERSIAWVHAWTVTDGIITQVREYFNTSLTVTRLGDSSSSSPSSRYGSSSSSSSTAEIASYHCPSVWESSLSNRVGKSVPGLVLAI